jgi:hypothetical protein
MAIPDLDHQLIMKMSDAELSFAKRRMINKREEFIAMGIKSNNIHVFNLVQTRIRMINREIDQRRMDLENCVFI